jgi:hypothetical protein
VERHFHEGLEDSWTFVAKASRTEHLKIPKLLRYQAGNLRRLLPRLVRARSLQRRELRRNRRAVHSLPRELTRRAHHYKGAMQLKMIRDLGRISLPEFQSISQQLSYLSQYYVRNTTQHLPGLIQDLARLEKEKWRR